MYSYSSYSCTVYLQIYAGIGRRGTRVPELGLEKAMAGLGGGATTGVAHIRASSRAVPPINAITERALRGGWDVGVARGERYAVRL